MKTIDGLQEFIASKPELRQAINEIVEYLKGYDATESEPVDTVTLGSETSVGRLRLYSANGALWDIHIENNGAPVITYVADGTFKTVTVS